jgi:hypothetical protein
MIRRMIRNNSVLYPLYIKHVLRNSRVAFPESDTDLHLTGFPRSANTYCFNIIDVAFPELNIITHLHTIASIKLAMRHNVPTIVVIREPVATCCSLLIMLERPVTPRLTGKYLKDYIDYHQFVLEHRRVLQLMRFEDVVKSPEFVIRQVLARLGITMSDEDIELKAREGQRIAEGKEAKKATLGSSLPRKERIEAKANVQPVVESHVLCKQAISLYEELMSDV